MVSGFTDDRQVQRGNQQFADNWELSAQRALTVTRALIEEGVPSSRVFAAAFGAEQPVASNADAEGPGAEPARRDGAGACRRGGSRRLRRASQLWPP
jgi:outer membrane protein OmpA-like peptidoglycan-associated protein